MKEYRWALEIHREDGAGRDQVPVSVDFGAAREYALFAGMRRSFLPPDEVVGSSSVLPLWHPDDGPPYLSGVRVQFDAAEDAHVDFGPDVFRPAARAESVTLVAQGRLREGEVFRFRPLAFPAPGPVPGASVVPVARDVSPGLRLRETPLGELADRATLRGAPHDGDFPVFVPEHVLDDIRDVSQGAGDHETGGFLVGRLHRDPSVPEIFLEVTGQIPARHVISDTDRLTFTERTWTDAQGILDLRGGDEQWCGWWHRHPVASWCRNCAPEKQRVCRLASDFFSEHDRQVQRAVFSRAYNVALVFNDVAFTDASFSLFGWRDGDIHPRGFHLIAGHAPRRKETAHAEDA